MHSEIPARVALPLLIRLKLTLLKRHFQRNQLGAAGTIVVILVFTLALSVGAVSVLVYAKSGGAVARDHAFIWSAWILSFLWLNAPLSQFDTQRSLDLSALRLLPLSAGTFTRAVLLDALVSPQGVILALPLALLIVAFTRTPAELPLVLLSLALLLVANVALGQALYLWVSRLVSSRRFADISVVVGMVLIFAIQGLNLLLHMGRGFTALPPWMSASAGVLAHWLGPMAAWLYPSLASGVVHSAASGEPTLAALRATALLAQAGLALWLAGTATRAFYEGELESGGAVRRGAPQRARRSGTGPRPVWDLSLHGPTGALFSRDRSYLWREPLLKSLFIQSIFTVAYFSMLAVFLSVQGGEHIALLPPRYMLLGIAVMLTYAESYLLFNKFGLEGQEFTATLLSPISRERVLRAKSAFFMTHFLALNMLIITALGLALHVPALFVCAALVTLAGNACIVDVAGHFVSIWMPFAYRRAGRRFRPQFAQAGCGYMLLYGLITQACNMAAIPLSAAILLGTVYLGWAGLGGGAVLAALIAALAYRIGIPLAARQLAQREPELLEAVTRKSDL